MISRAFACILRPLNHQVKNREMFKGFEMMNEKSEK